MSLPSPGRGGDGPVLAATVCSFAMIANQVGGKAVRDGLFLSRFDVDLLPRMVVAAAVLTIVAVLLAARMLARVGPPRLVPYAFLASGLLQIGLGPLVTRAPGIAAVAFYAHMAVFGAVLISWYWSMINECFDPRTARRRIGRIAGGGTLGGLVGGIVAERVTAEFSIAPMLPVLGALHLLCAGLAAGVARAATPPAGPAPAGGEPVREAGAREGLAVLRGTPYLRNLALLVLVGTVAAGLLDFVLKARASIAFGDADHLVRFFGLFYTGVALVGFVVQSTLTRRLLIALQPGRTASLLPFTVGCGGLIALLVPGLPTAVLARGGEAAVRSSLFRSAYELFYGPLPRRVKRSAKTLVDVGFDRLGDAVGGAVVQLVLATGLAAAPLLTGLSSALGFAGFLVARRLHAGYVGALATSLVDRDEVLAREADESDDPMMSRYLGTVAHLELSGPLPDIGDDPSRAWSTGAIGAAAVAAAAAARPAGRETPPPNDPFLARVEDLRSGDSARVRRALRSGGDLPAELVGIVVPLLAWDPVASDAIGALRRVVDQAPGALLDRLLDADEEFAIRRRLPRVLAAGESDRIVEGLVRALDDRRFEVRYQSGIALARVRARRADAPLDGERVLAVVEREARVDRKVWEGHRLLDETPDADRSPFHDEILRDRASRSLEHVFTLLSLAYPPEPLRVAFRGLHAEDRTLRGTALEYLDSILPPAIRRALSPFLAPESPVTSRSADEALASLMQSRESIRLDLDALRRARAAESRPDVIDPGADRPSGGPPASGGRPPA